MTPKPPEPPKHLSAPMRRWWRATLRDYTVADHQRHLLRLAAEAYDRCQSARTVLDKHGVTITDRFGQEKPRAEVAIERDSRRDFADLVRQLDFPDKPEGGPLI